MLVSLLLISESKLSCTIPHCEICSPYSPIICNKSSPKYTRWIDGFIKSLNSSVFLIENCAEYNSEYSCERCKEGFVLKFNSNEPECPENCQCFNPNECLESSNLRSTRGVSNDRMTTSCDNNCAACVFGSCQYCSYGYYNGGAACVPCQSGCTDCNDVEGCTSCNSSYYLSSGSCFQCQSPCSACDSSASSCTSCVSGYILSASSCIQCQSSCSSCQSSGCSNCTSGYFLSNGNCSQCQSTCLACQSSSICTSCVIGYFLDASSSCIKCPNSCSKCQNSSCTSCLSGSFLSNGSCISCQSPCSECSSISICTTCIPNFSINSDGSCKLLCNNNCNNCSSDGTCLSCKAGYNLLNGNCTIGCMSNSNCTTCNDGYYLNSTTCVKCNSLCSKCVSNYKCTECISNYSLSSNGSCGMLCGSNCKDCSSEGECLSCNIGYSLVNGSCTMECGVGCAFCYSSMNCTKCNNGYSLDSNKICYIQEASTWYKYIIIILIGLVLLWSGMCNGWWVYECFYYIINKKISSYLPIGKKNIDDGSAKNGESKCLQPTGEDKTGYANVVAQIQIEPKSHMKKASNKVIGSIDEGSPEILDPNNSK